MRGTIFNFCIHLRYLPGYYLRLRCFLFFSPADTSPPKDYHGTDNNDNQIIGLEDPEEEEWFCLDCEECDSIHCEHNTHPRNLIPAGETLLKHFRSLFLPYPFLEESILLSELIHNFSLGFSGRPNTLGSSL